VINNFKLLEPLLEFTNPGDCYFIQFLKRHKDNPEMKKNMVNVDNLFIYSLEEFRDMEERIIEIATVHNARAYLRINRRNTEKLALQTLVKISNLILSKDYYSVKNAYLSAAGEHSSEPIKRWIVDVDRQPNMFDFTYTDYLNKIRGYIKELHDQCNRNSKQGVYKMLVEVETKNGVHIITNPFNLKEFNKYFEWHKLIRNPQPAPDIHKDNPTILYHP
jgi:hypothetical protein